VSAQRDDLRAQVLREQAVGSAVAAARNVAQAATTYDHRTLRRDFGWIRRFGTPSFVRSYAGTTDSLSRLVRASKAKAVGSVRAAAGTATGQSTVQVLLFVDQRLTRADREGISRDQTRVEMTMVHRGARWLVDDLTLY
jgi:hypothetical protein